MTDTASMRWGRLSLKSVKKWVLFYKMCGKVAGFPHKMCIFVVLFPHKMWAEE